MKLSSSNWRLTKFVLTILFISVVSLIQAQDQSSSDEIPTDEASISAGDKLFNNNCTACHRIHERNLGPALKEVYIRRPLPWIKSFISNSQKVIQSGDEYAVNLFAEYSPTVMPAFDFSDEEILSILSYIKYETENAVVADESSDASGTAVEQSGSTIGSGYITAILIALLVVLVLILIVLGVLISVVSKYIKQKGELDEADQEVVDQKFDIGKFARSPGFIWIVTFIFTAIVVKSVIDGLFTIGVQQGYQPEQPIAFSHKLHAGTYEIDCNYCHTGVRKSKNANIPSPNICLNCHSSIQKIQGADEPSAEIAKIHEAVKNNTPIEWVRIHNLPDLAYFNHKQHVAVGNIECQTCHGPIEEMEVVQQHSSLTMGWCIDCHRKTDVNSKGNDYYNELVKLHGEKSKEPMKVEDIGGLECAKCHY